MSKARGQSRELVVVEVQVVQSPELAKALWQSREVIVLEAQDLANIQWHFPFGVLQIKILSLGKAKHRKCVISNY